MRTRTTIAFAIALAAVSGLSACGTQESGAPAPSTGQAQERPAPPIPQPETPVALTSFAEVQEEFGEVCAHDVNYNGWRRFGEDKSVTERLCSPGEGHGIYVILYGWDDSDPFFADTGMQRVTQLVKNAQLGVSPHACLVKSKEHPWAAAFTLNGEPESYLIPPFLQEQVDNGFASISLGDCQPD